MLKFNKNYIPEEEVHLLAEEALYKLAYNQDTGMDTEQNHSIVGSTDNTVDMLVLAVELLMHHCHCHCCCC